MDNQQFFNGCVRRLVAQGRPSMQNGSCMYRGDNGTMCAVGQFIPDDEYDPEYESCSVMFGVKANQWPTITKLSETVNVGLMQSMQACHDGFGSYRQPPYNEDAYFIGGARPAATDPNWVENFKERAAQVAQAWKLNTGVLQS